jgi:hypothetical protein
MAAPPRGDERMIDGEYLHPVSFHQFRDDQHSFSSELVRRMCDE